MQTKIFFLSSLIFSVVFLFQSQVLDNSRSISNEIPTETTFQQTPLTKGIVRQYIKTSIREFQLQQLLKSQADVYENVIQEFYAHRKILLEEQGWTVEDYEAIEARIFTAQNALKLNDTMDSDDVFDQEIAEIKNNAYLTEKQKEETIKLLRLDRKNRLETFINPSQKDWPAIKAFLRELDHLTDYVAQNRADAPILK